MNRNRTEITGLYISRRFQFLACLIAIALVASFTSRGLLAANIGSSMISPQHVAVNEATINRVSETSKSSTPSFLSDGAGGAASMKLPLCTMEQVKTGAWKPVRLPKPPFIPTYLQFRNECYTNDQVRSAPHWDTYDWEPLAVSKGACAFPAWDANEFCELSRDKTIAIVGDSLSLEHFTALAHQLGYTGNTDDIWRPEFEGENFIVKVCNGQTTLLHRRSFFLERMLMAHMLDAVTPDVMVLNRGSWYANDVALLRGIGRISPILQAYQSKCRSEKHSDCHLIWRTTVPGHPGCMHFTKPATSVAAMEAHIANLSLYSKFGQGKFHWWDFAHQNSLAVERLREKLSVDNSSSAELDVMPAYEINILRPDLHTLSNRTDETDCLHNCALAGKTTVYNQLLLHLMRLRKQSHDAAG